ncbi:MAG: hypothetical protein IKL80_04850 [Clostridia bacterium]|nr:hypothetical protein [Clostridia bacterium]
MRKTLTKESLYSIVNAELYSDTTLHLTIFSDMKENEDASLVAKISYADGTQGIYINPVNDNGFRLIRYAQGKKISGAQFFIWDMSGVRPLAYSDTLN